VVTICGLIFVHSLAYTYTKGMTDMKLTGFNADDFQTEQRDFSPLPAGEYLAVITASTEKGTRAGTGSYLELTFQVIDGEHKGRQLWERLNINNPNKTAEQIARESLAAICKAIGITTPDDSSELHDAPMVIIVGHRKRQDNGEITNVIKGYKREGAAPPVQQAPKQAPGKPAWV